MKEKSKGNDLLGRYTKETVGSVIAVGSLVIFIILLAWLYSANLSLWIPSP